MTTGPNTFFDDALADDLQHIQPLNISTAQMIFDRFGSSPLFRWHDANNDCEDRANAICILLDKWSIANAKAWVFGGNFSGKQDGLLTNFWKYHVAAAVPVLVEGATHWLVIDPATCRTLTPVNEWALQITQFGCSYHFIKRGNWYIFPSCKIAGDNWHKRDKRNYNWTMQGLTGFNGASIKGRAQLAFHKRKVKQTVTAFLQMMKEGLPTD